MAKADQPSDESIYDNRCSQLEQLRKQGFRYPNSDLGRSKESVSAAVAATKVSKGSKESFEVLGRIVLIRKMGKSAFATLEDASGRIQLYAAATAASSDKQSCLDELLSMDLGDIVRARGSVFRTRKNEPTIHLEQLELLAKCLRPLPDKHKGLADPQLRVRKRHLALLTDSAEKQRFINRARLIRCLREFFDGKGYTEVETPMMHPIPGGAVARPFVTHHQALDMQLYLRVAPELYLKRLLVGGFDKVYELNRSFRNEGVSAQHNPEFSMLEFYQAYANYKDAMDLTEDLFEMLLEKFDKQKVKWRGHEINLKTPWERIKLTEALVKHAGVSAEHVNDAEKLAEKLSGFAGSKVAAADKADVGKLQMLLFEKAVEEKLVQPVFVTDFPASVSPLARRSDDDPNIAERFELYIGGREIANGFSELNDPVLQAEVFRAQAKAAAAGDDEAMHFDASYIEALESGMPPAAGEGIGVDRLAMLLLECDSIREVVLFPLVRPEGTAS